MPHVIHYQDDLYLIDCLARFLSDAARLEPDAEIIGDSVLGCIKNLDGALRRIRDLIQENEHLIERLEYIRLLARVARDSGEAIDTLLRPEASLASVFASSKDELLRVAQSHKALSRELAELLSTALSAGEADEDLVSGDELSELLKE